MKPERGSDIHCREGLEGITWREQLEEAFCS
jgi:hypothetical protein